MFHKILQKHFANWFYEDIWNMVSWLELIASPTLITWYLFYYFQKNIRYIFLLCTSLMIKYSNAIQLDINNSMYKANYIIELYFIMSIDTLFPPSVSKGAKKWGEWVELFCWHSFSRRSIAWSWSAKSGRIRGDLVTFDDFQSFGRGSIKDRVVFRWIEAKNTLLRWGILERGNEFVVLKAYRVFGIRDL